MRPRPARAGLLALTLILAAGPGAAQAPIVNATIEKRTVRQDLAREIQSVADRGAAEWVAYRVPIARRSGASPASSATCCGRCRLEPPTDLLVLARVEQRAVVAIRPVSIDCDIDAAGMPLVWLDGVDGDDSVRWLRSVVSSVPAPPRRLWSAALAALAGHAAPSAVPALTEIARAHADRAVRSQAMLRLGQSSDPRAVDFLAQILLK